MSAQKTLQAKLAAFPQQVVVKGYDAQTATSQQKKDHKVEFYGDYQATVTASRPVAYLIPHEFSRVADRLRMHGIQLEQLSQTTEVDVEIYRLKKLQRRPQPFQGHRLVRGVIEKRHERRAAASRMYVVRTRQPLGQLASYLLEPDADDSLLVWNFFDHVVDAGDDYPVLRVTQDVSLVTTPVTEIEPAQRLDLDQIYGPQRRVAFGGTFPLSLRWLPKSAEYLQTVRGREMRMDAATGAAEPFHDVAIMRTALAALPAISDDDARSLSRRVQTLAPDATATLMTFANDLFYYRFGDRTAKRLTNSAAVEKMPTFSPNGKMVAFVRQHNLYVVEIETGLERPLTTGGTSNLLYGELDWVYQEEIYGRGNFKGFWWSPDSTRLALLPSK